jgi:intracellular septation protein A
MKSINRRILLSVLMIVFLFGPIFAANAINVDNPGNAFAAANFTQIINRVANFITSFIAILAIIFLVYGGLLYVTAGGDESQIEKAKTTITYAIWGLFLAGLAYAIARLIINTVINNE